jgi:glycerophosphoryl diester phosphodiesterase
MKKIVLLALLGILLSLGSYGKNTMPLYLTNYTFNDKSDVVGEIKINASIASKIESIKVEGENGGFFKIGKGNKLQILKNKLNPSQKWFDIVVTVNTSEGELKQSFRIVKDEFIKNKVIAHRGAWKNTGTPENSIAALKQAIELNCAGSEFDVHMTSDSVPFINHDPHIQGVSIAKSTSAEVSQIKLADGEPIPTLENFLKSGIGQNKTKLILEIKESELGKEHSIALTKKIVRMVESLHAQAWVDYISFDFDICLEVMKLAPYAKVAYLMGDKSPSQLATDHFYGIDYHFSVMDKNPEWFAEAKENKQTINVWTVNDEAMMKSLLEKNVDFITTNEPELLLKLVGKKS